MPLRHPITTPTYPLPTAYCKSVDFIADGTAIRLKGGRALVLDLLIAASSNGIDRSATLQWIANISDTICALRGRGLVIETYKGHPANYVLRSAVFRSKASS
jgi:hypothetical protein